MNRVISALTLFFFFMGSTAYAQNPVSLGAAQYDPQISPMKKGDRAPFDGTLFNKDAAAKILVDIENRERQCMIETEKAVETAKAKSQLELDNLSASYEALKKSSEARLDLKNEHIEFLEEEGVKMAKKERRTVLWLLGGIAGGIALTVAGGLIIREVRPQSVIVVESN